MFLSMVKLATKVTVYLIVIITITARGSAKVSKSPHNRTVRVPTGPMSDALDKTPNLSWSYATTLQSFNQVCRKTRGTPTFDSELIIDCTLQHARHVMAS